ncbi:hypothetical protein BDZ94DRAFT_1279126 [Collybia nuda]|uniref:JmjC domain-containing protein n=1 Tax=Collybia nuda TaxID=64659 RepID=A0A9P5YIB4_9AGAR|nr:hypothetical protein BDZ94DRAFT_1279126 [Collybia nuda]
MNRVVEPSPNPSKCRISTREWTLSSLIKSGERFHPVPRIIASSEPKRLLAKIENSEKTGIPLIIEGWHKHSRWLKEMFHIDNFRANGSADIDVRNVHDWTDKTIPLSEFIAKSRAAPILAYPEEKERLYGKDAECPKEWNKWLHEANVIPSLLLPDGPNNLLLNQPRSSHVETLMCYLGIGDTFTPCHKDLCASSGQNLMCYTENGGSSYWFMTSGSDAPQASAYFQQLNQELDHETYVVTVEELSKAPFKIYIAEQKLGDLVLVPPRSCHQVVNKGGLTVKTSWSRMTLKGLETAYYHELPIYRRVCRPETYRVQSTIHYTLLRMTAELENIISHQSSPGPFDVKSQSDEFIDSMRRILQLFDLMLLDEFSPNNNQMHCLSSSSSPLGTASPAPSNASSATLIPNEKEKEGGYIPVTCDFCGADIFQSFFECRTCVNTQELQGRRRTLPGDGYVVCPSCYSEGRSCKCRIMDPTQCRPFEELLQHRKKARNALHLYTGDNSWLERLLHIPEIFPQQRELSEQRVNCNAKR